MPQLSSVLYKTSFTLSHIDHVKGKNQSSSVDEGAEVQKIHNIQFYEVRNSQSKMQLQVSLMLKSVGFSFY